MNLVSFTKKQADWSAGRFYKNCENTVWYYAASRCAIRDAKLMVVFVHGGSLMIQTFSKPMANLETSMSMARIYNNIGLDGLDPVWTWHWLQELSENLPLTVTGRTVYKRFDMILTKIYGLNTKRGSPKGETTYELIWGSYWGSLFSQVSH